MDSSSHLCWSPLIDSLSDYASKDAPINIIVAPFIQLKALELLFQRINVSNNLRVLTRWNKNDLKSGVSDPGVFKKLNSRGGKLYINKNLHSKIYLQEDGWALVGSGNLTEAGLGMSHDLYQIETGVFVKFTALDQLRISSLFEDADIVTDDIYNLAVDLANGEESSEKEACDELLHRKFRLADLPISKSPRQLWEAYMKGYPKENGDTIGHDAWLDILRYRIPFSLKNQNEFEAILKKEFLSRPIVSKILKFIEDYTPIGMGAFNPSYEGVQNGAIRKLLDDKVETDRYELSLRINNLQSWLPFCKPQIEIDVSIPGRGASRVFYWRKC